MMIMLVVTTILMISHGGDGDHGCDDDEKGDYDDVVDDDGDGDADMNYDDADDN